MKPNRTAALLAIFLLPLQAFPQQGTPPASSPPAAANQEFLRVADEVMNEVSRIIELPVKFPLKKSLRSRQQIRDFVVSEMDRDREPAKREADRKVLEKFGLLPKHFPLRQFLIDLLTEQIAGLYNPREKEFFIADWMELEMQRMVMAHELVHALQDQHFNVESWTHAARPNDDAELARHSVLEGGAIMGMIEHSLRAQKISVRDVPGFEQILRGQLTLDLGKSPELAKAPPYIREVLLFPYVSGALFSYRMLKENGGWTGFHDVFARPPTSTQQILHPEIYLNRIERKRVVLPEGKDFLGRGWKTLDENVLGEFGLHLLLKQFLGEERAARLSPAWAGDLYGAYENEKTKNVVLAHRQRFDSEDNALRFFGAFSEALEKRHENRRTLFRRPNFFSFETESGGVFLYCIGGECLLLDGADRASFDKLVRGLRWPAAPVAPAQRTDKKVAVYSGPGELRVNSSTAQPISPITVH